MTVRLRAIVAAALLAAAATPVAAQQKAASGAPIVSSAPRAAAVPLYSHPVSPYHYNQPFPPTQFWSELVAKSFTRQALDASYHTREVDLANAASRMIDGGDCTSAANYLETMGAPDMAARVPATCSAKRKGLI